jgi:hypothetical protein
MAPLLRDDSIPTMAQCDAGAGAIHTINRERLAKLKAALRKAAERTPDGLWNAIGHLIPTFTPAECVKLPRFGGHPARFRERCRHAENPSTLLT